MAVGDGRQQGLTSGSILPGLVIIGLGLSQKTPSCWQGMRQHMHPFPRERGDGGGWWLAGVRGVRQEKQEYCL